MKKVDFLKKKPFFSISNTSHFSIEKSCGNESHEKENKHIFASTTDLLHIRIGNLNWVQMRTLQKQSERNRLSLL